MKYTFLPLLLALLLLTGCTPADIHEAPPIDTTVQEPLPTPEAAAYQSISMEEAVERMETAEDYILLDVRRSDEFAAGHIPGAVHIANEAIGTEELADLPDKEQLIFVYCRSGRRSKEAAEKLAALGYINIVEIGEILDWTGETEQ